MTDDNGKTDLPASEDDVPKADEPGGGKPSRGALYLIPLLIVAAIAISFILPLVSNSPENAVKRVGKAFQDQDLSSFREFIDVETVLSRALEDVLGSVDDLLEGAPEGASGDAGMEGFEEFGGILGMGIFGAMIPELISPIENAIEKAVENGELKVSDLTLVAGGFLGDLPTKELPDEDVDLIALLEERLEVVKVSETSRSGKTANVDLVITDTETDKTVTLDLLMRDTGSNWQIVEITNLSELLDELPTDKLSESLLGDPFGMGMIDDPEGMFGDKHCSEDSENEADSGAEAGEWTEVFKASGSGDKTTDKFTIANSPFRVTWEATAGNEEPNRGDMDHLGFSAYLFCSGTSPMMGMPTALIADSFSNTSKGATEIFDSGEMFIDVMAHEGQWDIKVEERR